MVAMAFGARKRFLKFFNVAQRWISAAADQDRQAPMPVALAHFSWIAKSPRTIVVRRPGMLVMQSTCTATCADTLPVLADGGIDALPASMKLVAWRSAQASHKPSCWFGWSRFCAEGGTRTHTLLRAADFESAASTDSATSARLRSIADRNRLRQE